MSAITDQAERAVANARFSSYGRRLLGPRLPLPVDLETMGPEVAFAAFGAIRALHRVLETQGSVPPEPFSSSAPTSPSSRGCGPRPVGDESASPSLYPKIASHLLSRRPAASFPRPARVSHPSSSSTRISPSSLSTRSQPGGVLFGDVCLNPYAVLHLNQLERLVTSAFVHRDLFHLLANMTGVLEDGAYLEARDGFGPFLARSAGLLGLSQCFLVGLSSAERRLAKVGGGAPRWLDDASRVVSGRRFDLDVSGALLPFYTSGVVGFSGVNYAFRAVACHRRPRNQIVLVFGVVPVPVQFSFWADLAVNTLVVPASGTFAGHFAGCLAGLTAVYAPRFVGMGPLGGGRFGNAGAGRAYSGRGRRLGGRYLLDDEPGAATPEEHDTARGWIRTGADRV